MGRAWSTMTTPGNLATRSTPTTLVSTAPALEGARTVAAAAALMAQHVMAKASRDSLFISHFAVSRLPAAVVGSAVLSALSAFALSRAMSRRTPARTAPVLLATSAGALALVWAVAQVSEPAAAILAFVHSAILGATTMSAFWSAVNEAFDPHRSRDAIARIGAGSAFGAAAGGLLAWRGAHALGAPTLFAIAGSLQLVAALGMRGLRSRRAGPEPVTGTVQGALGALRGAPYLRALGLLVVLVSAADTLMEFAFSSRAAASLGGGPALLAYLAGFQTLVGLSCLAMQTAVGGAVLARLGVAQTAALLPLWVILAGSLGATLPGAAVTTALRGAQAAVQGSLFRSAYEILYVPLPPVLKRSTKAVVDVGCDRLGTALGGILLIGALATAPRAPASTVILVAVLVMVGALGVLERVHEGYVETLASNLRAGVVRIDPRSVVDKTTLATLSLAAETIKRDELLQRIRAFRGRTVESPREELTTAERQLGELLRALDDDRFDVRRDAALALSRAAERGEAALDDLEARAAIRRAVRRELARPGGAPQIDHVLTLLSIAGSRAPLRLVPRGLRSSDDDVRGAALEYLHEALPRSVRGVIQSKMAATDPFSDSAQTWMS
jgi:ATP:ADP antiporter, AAA family